MRRVWAKTIAHAQKLQEYNDKDDLKTNMPRATLVDINIDDPSDVIGDTSIYDEAVYKAKLNPEVYKRRTVDDPAVEITRVAEGIEEEIERVNTSMLKLFIKYDISLSETICSLLYCSACSVCSVCCSAILFVVLPAGVFFQLCVVLFLPGASVLLLPFILTLYWYEEIKG